MLQHLRHYLWPDLEADLAGEPLHVIRAGLFIILLFCIGATTWMAWVPVAGAIVAQGAIKVEGQRRPIQHPHGGVVETVLVKNGQQVRAGQPLIRFTDARIDATYTQLQLMLEAEQARSARLEAEQNQSNHPVFPTTLLNKAAGQPQLQALLEREHHLFSVRTKALKQQEQLLDEQQQEILREEASLRAQLQAAMDGQKLMADEVKANQALLDKGFISPIRLTGLQRGSAEYAQKVNELRADLQRAQQKATDQEIRKSALRANFIQSASAELKDSANRQMELTQQLRPSEEAARQQVLTAPVAGEIMNLRIPGPGSVVGAGELLMELVPANQRLVVEAKIDVRNYHRIQHGAAVDVRLPSFNHRNTPMVRGRIVYLSADQMTDRETGFAYYLAQVELDHQSLANAGNPQLQAGLPASIYIRLRERSVLGYLTEPLTDSMDRAFREP